MLNIRKVEKCLDDNMVKVRKVVNILIIILFGVQVVVVFIQVIARFIFINPFSWSEEMARYIQVWMILLVSSICVRKNAHFAIDYLIYKLNFRYKKILDIMVNLIVLFYIFIITTYGWRIVVTIFTFSQTSPAMLIPMYLIYLAIPVSGLLMFLEGLIRLLKLIRLKNNNKDL